MWNLNNFPEFENPTQPGPRKRRGMGFQAGPPRDQSRGGGLSEGAEMLSLLGVWESGRFGGAPSWESGMTGLARPPVIAGKFNHGPTRTRCAYACASQKRASVSEARPWQSVVGNRCPCKLFGSFPIPNAGKGHAVSPLRCARPQVSDGRFPPRHGMPSAWRDLLILRSISSPSARQTIRVGCSLRCAM